MTGEDMRQRDRLVFTLCGDLGIPVVWNLAGGYQRDRHGGIFSVLDLHLATKEECVDYFSVGAHSVDSPAELGSLFECWHISDGVCVTVSAPALHGTRALRDGCLSSISTIPPANTTCSVPARFHEPDVTALNVVAPVIRSTVFGPVTCGCSALV